MTKFSIAFLQAVILLIGFLFIVFLAWMPLMEGRATHLSLMQIYLDPFILYIYMASIAFFAGLYQAFKLLMYIGQNKVFTFSSVQTLKTIKYCAWILSGFIVLAGIYIRLFHHKDDDPAGFLAICMITAFSSFVVATAAAIFEKLLQSAVEMKNENDLTV